jgi:hypothetical protein
MPVSEFWRLADDTRVTTQADADTRFAPLAEAPIDELRRVWRHYRSFTRRYITDLALLVSRLPAGGLRSSLGLILADELGQGDSERDHLRLFDRFLLSCEVPPSRLEEEAPGARQVLEDLGERVRTFPVAYAVGLRGMGGECMCSLYLASMERHFAGNPWVVAHRPTIDWTFWDLHLGEVDEHHERMLRDVVNGLIEGSPADEEAVAAGFRHANESWTRFWDVVLPAGETTAMRVA